MFFSLLSISLSVDYLVAATEMTISGKGVITKLGVSSKGFTDKIKKVVIKEGPTEIAEKAFEKMESLTEIHIPLSVSTISGPLFIGCKSLTNINVAKGSKYFVTDDQHILYNVDKTVLIRAPAVLGLKILEPVAEIFAYAFQAGSFSYGDIVFPKTLVTLTYHSLYNSQFKSVSFAKDSQITKLNGFSWAFIETLTIPKSVTSIGKSEFEYSSIANYVFESNSGLKEIGPYAFSKIRTIAISLPENVETISEYAFEGSRLETIKIGSKCSNISTSAFAGCLKLKTIDIAKSNKNFKIEDNVIMDSLGEQIVFIPLTKKSITISSNVNKIGQNALQSCTLLKTLNIDNNNNWKSDSGVLYSFDFTKLIAVCGGVTSFVIRPETKVICEYSANSCANLQYANISDKGSALQTIERFAFYRSGLLSFSLPNSVTVLGESCFAYSYYIASFEISAESQLERIEPDSFYWATSLRSFFFPKKLNLVNRGAFWKSGVTEISFDKDTILTGFEIYAFETARIVHLNIPSSFTSIKDRVFKENYYLETVTFSDNSLLTSIDSDAFLSCPNISSIVLPSRCQSIGVRAFANCTKLSSIEHNAKTIGNLAFANCTKFLSFNFSTTQEVYLQDTFMNCINLVKFAFPQPNDKFKAIIDCVYTKDSKTLVLFPPGNAKAIIPPETESFADNAFAWSPCVNLVAFKSGSNLVSIGVSTFYECKKLSVIQFPPKLRTIYELCFYGCSSIKSIILPSSLETIQNSAFLGCSSLTYVTYCGTNVIEGSKAFDKHIIVSVTDLYPSETFCSNPIARRLDLDCQVKAEFLPSCEYLRKRNTLYLFLVQFSSCITD